MGLHVLTFHDLPKGSLTENIQNQIPLESLLRCEQDKRRRQYSLLAILTTEPVVDIEDVVVVFVIVSIVMNRLARFCQHPPWVVC